MNDDKNWFGRAVALLLIAGAVYGVRSIARGRSACPFVGGSSRCAMPVPAAVPVPAVETKAAPAAKPGANIDSGGDEDAKLERKAPVVPPATPK